LTNTGRVAVVAAIRSLYDVNTSVVTISVLWTVNKVDSSKEPERLRLLITRDCSAGDRRDSAGGLTRVERDRVTDPFLVDVASRS
jgi:hypothetical protein